MLFGVTEINTRMTKNGNISSSCLWEVGTQGGEWGEGARNHSFH